ncbi:MAG TPA: right-handed parallel beta-helix repeat-containing protein [Planctomycetota bacterium]
MSGFNLLRVGCALLSTLVAVAEEPALEITADTRLDPAKTYSKIVIKASNITVDGQGAWVVGAREGSPSAYKGTGIESAGVSKVTLRNVNVKGWETGLKIEDGAEWLVENCDFSDNFHDPEFGWGEHGRRGGIVLSRVSKSTLRKNKANRVWDGCVLVDCMDNTLADNDFSHASNTCLKLWASCRNQIQRNNLSYGLRIKPGEVHARDSTSVLIESGSNDNRFIGNDCTHGGDGIFIRVLNGWVSTGNYFEENDCSYANNNCVEAWSPRNTYVRNKANHGSYGFWLGASDQTVLLGNEASENGDPKGMHNSPHLPGNGHAGIVFMFGPSSHTIVRGNTCRGNNGAGIAVIGDTDSKGAKWKAYHWIIEQNVLNENRWGIYAQYADWLDVAANTFEKNSEGDFKDAGGLTNLTQYVPKAEITKPPKAVLEGPAMGKVGQPVMLDASKSSDPAGGALRFRWDLGDGTFSTEPRVTHAFAAPGFYRVGLTVNNGLLSDLAWRDFYAVEDVEELGTEGQAADWSWVDPQSKAKFSDDREVRISGRSSLYALIQPYSGMRVNLLYPSSRKAGWPLAGKKSLVFWFKGVNENVPAWQDANPIVTLHETEQKFVRLTPKRDLLSAPPYIEAREGWTYFVVPLAGDELWKRDSSAGVPAGAEMTTANWLTIGFDSWGAPPLRIWLDGLAFKP